jgi:hypothetical protein
LAFGVVVVVAVVADQADVDGREQGENQGLDQADEQLEKVENEREIRCRASRLSPPKTLPKRRTERVKGRMKMETSLDQADDEEDTRESA